MTKQWTLRVDLDLRSSLGERTFPDAVVIQEDRNLVMGPQGFVDLDEEDDLDQAYATGRAQRPLPLGGVLVFRGRENGQPWTYHAVVHDLELDPSCRPGDVRRCLCAAVKDASGRGFGHLAVEPLGRWHSRGLSLEEMAEAFDAAILEICSTLEVSMRLTLLLKEIDQVEETSNFLRSCLLRRARRSFRTVDGDAAVVEVREEDARYHFHFVPGTLSGYLVRRLDANN